MKKFEHHNAQTIDEAVSLLETYGGAAKIIAGGTDIVGGLKAGIYPDPPEAIINIKTIPGLSYIQEWAGALQIGALTTLTEIAESSIVRSKYVALAEAASKTASPILRNLGTLGGNICQEIRCWYYRYPHRIGGRVNCLRKDPTGICNALIGDNRYHSIFGAVDGCIAVNPSDTAPALIALDAKIVTSKRTIDAEDFFTVNGPKTTVLDDDEIVTEIQIPEFSGKSSFIKFAPRKSIDFPIVNCAAAISNGTARICLNAVHNNPYRATAAEEAIAGKPIDEASAEAAGAAAVADASPASPVGQNKYMIQIAKVMVKRAVLACK